MKLYQVLDNDQLENNTSYEANAHNVIKFSI
jgi:hypothetical protein